MTGSEAHFWRAQFGYRGPGRRGHGGQGRHHGDSRHHLQPLGGTGEEVILSPGHLGSSRVIDQDLHTQFGNPKIALARAAASLAPTRPDFCRALLRWRKSCVKGGEVRGASVGCARRVGWCALSTRRRMSWNPSTTSFNSSVEGPAWCTAKEYSGRVSSRASLGCAHCGHGYPNRYGDFFLKPGRALNRRHYTTNVDSPYGH